MVLWGGGGGVVEASGGGIIGGFICRYGDLNIISREDLMSYEY